MKYVEEKNISTIFFTGWDCGVNSKKIFIPIGDINLNREWRFAFHAGINGLPLQTAWDLFMTEHSFRSENK